MEIWKKMWVGIFFWTQCIYNALGGLESLENGEIMGFKVVFVTQSWAMAKF